MTDQELRELVRASIAKQLGEGSRSSDSGSHSSESGWRSPSGLANTPAQPVRIHASHGVYAIAREDGDGPCIIEPSVPCTHCDYCKSHGH